VLEWYNFSLLSAEFIFFNTIKDTQPMKNEDHEKPTMGVEADGKIILEVEMDEDNFDWIRAARKQREKKATEHEDANNTNK
jgi:hypothetical protein